MRKIISLSLCLLLCVCTLSGCSKKGSEFVGTWESEVTRIYHSDDSIFITLDPNGKAKSGLGEPFSTTYHVLLEGTWVVSADNKYVEIKYDEQPDTFNASCVISPEGKLKCGEINYVRVKQPNISKGSFHHYIEMNLFVLFQ